MEDIEESLCFAVGHIKTPLKSIVQQVRAGPGDLGNIR